MLLKRFISLLLLIAGVWLITEKIPTHHNGIVLKSEKSNSLAGVNHFPTQNTLSKYILCDDLGDFGDKVFQNLQDYPDGGYFGTRFNNLLLFVQNKATVTSVLNLNNHKFPHLFILFHSWKYLSI